MKIAGEEHPNVAWCYNNIGAIYGIQGEYGKALEYFQKSLAIWLKVFAEGHPEVADSYKEIAYALRALKIEEEAFEKMRQSV